MARKILLSRDLVATVDEADFDRVSAFSWHAKPSFSKAGPFRGWYAARTIKNGRRNTTVYLHRFIMDAPAEATVDHVDGDGLNNTRANLRLCTLSQNNANRPSRSFCGYRGVVAEGVWFRAQIQRGKLNLRGRRRASAAEAAADYDEFARSLFGEFAVLNFPESSAA